MIETPRGNRVHIAIYGRTNAGKSSLINKITNQDISLVSEMRGTTTDPVYKAMELLPIGPVVFIDTAGIDDTTELGELRVKKTKEILNKMDIALLLISTEVLLENQDLSYEKEWIREIKKREKPFIVILNKMDLVPEGKAQELIDRVKAELECEVSTVATSREESIQRIKAKLIEYAPK